MRRTIAILTSLLSLLLCALTLYLWIQSHRDPGRTLLFVAKGQGPSRQITCWQLRSSTGELAFLHTWPMGHPTYMFEGKEGPVMILTCDGTSRETYVDKTSFLNQAGFAFEFKHYDYYGTRRLFWGVNLPHWFCFLTTILPPTLVIRCALRHRKKGR